MCWENGIHELTEFLVGKWFQTEMLGTRKAQVDGECYKWTKIRGSATREREFQLGEESYVGQ